MDGPPTNAGCRRCRELEAQIAKLTERIEQLERESKRQAAPFRKKNKKAPKKPGRKPGDEYGPRHARAVPERIDEIHRAPLPCSCPKCGGRNLSATETVVQYQTDVVRTVVHRRFDIEVGVCPDCRRRVQGRHELQTSDATGAAAVQFGPEIHAAIAILNKDFGLPHGKIRRLFRMLFELDVGRATSCRSVLKTGKKLAAAHEEAKQAVRASPAVVPDETGWRVGGKNAWLHAFVGKNATVYRIDPTRSAAPAVELLGADWSDALIHDGWSVYDKFVQAMHQQCLAHLLRRCKQLVERGRGAAQAFPKKVKRLLKQALELRDRFRAGEATAHGLMVMAGRLKSAMHDLVYPNKKDPSNERFAAFLYKHLDSLFAFLRDPEIDATNHLAEQAIRPAVVNRKVWGGNRTWPGALAQARIATVLRTLHQRLADPLAYLRCTLLSPTPLPLPAIGR